MHSVFSFHERLLRRLVTLISKLAVLEASHEAVVKQAKGATEQCRKLLDENDELKVRNYMLYMMQIDLFLFNSFETC